MPQMDGVADPILSTPDPGSSPRAYRDEDDEDDNPYSQGRHRMSKQPSGYGMPKGKADKCPSWKVHSMERRQEYRTSQKMCQVFRDAGETADSLNFLLIEYQQDSPPPFETVLRDIDSLFKVNRVANALDILGEFNFSSSSATEAIAKIEKLSKLVVWQMFQ